MEEFVQRADGRLSHLACAMPVSLCQRLIYLRQSELQSKKNYWRWMIPFKVIFRSAPKNESTALIEDLVQKKRLMNKTHRMAIKQTPYHPFSQKARTVSRNQYQVTDGVLTFREDPTIMLMNTEMLLTGIQTFGFSFKGRFCEFSFAEDAEGHRFEIPLNGTRRQYQYKCSKTPASEIYLSGYWNTSNMFVILAR